MPDATPQPATPPEILPSEGGSYIRNADGTLTKVDEAAQQPTPTPTTEPDGQE